MDSRDRVDNILFMFNTLNISWHIIMKAITAFDQDKNKGKEKQKRK